jgi:glycosyltransferase involved in cell wall biosynthesis
MTNWKVSAGIIFHREGYYAIPALKSFSNMTDAAKHKGIEVETFAVLDRSDAITRHILENSSVKFNSIIETDVGDLGMSRNAVVAQSTGDFIVFFDGDDLWGADWIHRALLKHRELEGTKKLILHPEFLFYFDEYDFSAHSVTAYPHESAKSFWFRQLSTDDLRFDPRTLLMNNIWSANSFARREVYETHPYHQVDRHRGFGVEDWAWNIETVWCGAQHGIVPDTVHIIRVKQEGSLGQQNVKEGLLLPLPQGFKLTEWQS